MMSDGPSNPYQAPDGEAETVVPTKPLLPPITLVRLVLGLALITICWAGIWLKVREGLLIGYWLSVLAGIGVVWVVDPSARKREISIKPKEVPLLVICIALGFAMPLGTFLGAKGSETRHWLEHAMVQPSFLIFCWLFFCGGLVLAWWKRQNNPPYQPEPDEDIRSDSKESSGSLPYE